MLKVEVLEFLALQRGIDMERKRKRLFREAFAKASARLIQPRYRPEKHYMRGPGPKTLMKLGEMLRTEFASVVREEIPQQWVELIELADRRQEPP